MDAISKLNERSKIDVKMACLEAALRTQIIDKDQLMHHALDGPDKVLEAAKNYYEWINKEKEKANG